MDIPLLVIGCGTAAVGSLLMIILLLAKPPKQAAESRLGTLSITSAGLSRGRSQSLRSRSIVLRDEPALRPAGARLVQAGLYRRDSMAMYMVFKVVLTLLPVLVGFAAATLGWVPYLHGVLGGGVMGIAGTLLPSFYLDAQKRRRQSDLRRALPDALDVIVVCVEAGLTVSAALARVASELRAAHPLLASEMQIVEREVQMGCTTGQALKRLADRFDLGELRSLASVILQAEKFGASISSALRVHAETLRTKRFQLAEERAQKASVKLLFPTIFFIFPTLFVVLMGPAVFEISKFLSDFNLR